MCMNCGGRIEKTSSGEDERTYMGTVDGERSMGTKRRVGEEKIEDKEQTETEGDAAESAEMR